MEKKLKISEDFTYLGSILSRDTMIDKEIKARIKKAAITFGNLKFRVWKPRNISTSTKIAIYKTCVLSVLLYGCASWNTYKRHINKLETFHHRCLRYIMNIRWQQMIPTTQVLERAGLSCIETMISQTRLRWLGHVRRMPDHRYPKIILFSELLKGKRARQKPKQRWKDIIKNDMRKFHVDGRTWYADSGSENRNTWRTMLYTSSRNFEELRRDKLKTKRIERNK